MGKKEAFHGSDLEKIEAYYGIKKENIINFAANVNPLGLSPLVKAELAKQIDVITHYPDRDYKELRSSIAAYTNANADHIVVGNGSTELISAMAQFLQPKSALILAPTYSEYEREIGLSGGTIDYFELKESDDFNIRLDDLWKTLEADYDLFVICNPNNPTSSAITKEQMAAIFAECKKHNTFVMVDETYVEFAPNKNLISCVSLSDQYDNFICLRGVSKFYSAPGLRLGYAITSNSKLLEIIHTKQNPWTVNSLAELAGILMYQDKDFQYRTETLMHQEQTRLFHRFSSSNKYKPYKANANFMLLKILDNSQNSTSVFEEAIRHGFMIRNCDSFPFLENRYIRFCFMNPEDNDRLADLLLSL